MLLDRLFGPTRRASFGQTVSLDDERYWKSHPWGHRTASGVTVTEEKAFELSAIFCASRVVSETPASLPLITYRRDGDDRHQAPDHPLFDLLKVAPNPDMGSMSWRIGQHLHQANAGSGFSEIEREDWRDPYSTPVALWPIHAARVRRRTKYDAGPNNAPLPPEYRYIVRNDDGIDVPLRSCDVLHTPGILSDDGIWGRGVLKYARETAGAGLAMQRHAASSFGSGNMPRAVVFMHGLQSDETRKAFRENWKAIHAGPDGDQIALLGPNDKLEKLGFSNEDSQYILSSQHNVDDFARFYRIPPHTIMSLMRATFSNIEQQGLDLIAYGLYPWVRLFEEQIHLKLLSPTDRQTYYCEHVWASLLRGDIATRFAAYTQAILNGYMTINECRKLENLNGIGPAGDQHLVPLNMTTAEKMLMDAQPNRTVAAVPVAPPAALPPPPENAAAMAESLARLAEALADRPILVSAAIAPVPPPAPAPLPPVRDDDAIEAAAREVIVSAMTWIGRKEANACRRVVESKGDFDEWLKEFFGAKHYAAITEALAPAINLLGIIGTLPPAGFESHLCFAAGMKLNDAYGSDNPEQFAARLAEWPATRAKAIADMLTGEETS